MRGYVSFIIVLISLVLVFSLLELRAASDSMDLSKAVFVERLYSVQMNAKECVLEAARQGAMEGFEAYDASHELGLCKHCPDSYCSSKPSAHNRCDQMLCSQCFREHDARAQANEFAKAAIARLDAHQFDPDIKLDIADADITVFTKPGAAAKNGYSFDYLRFNRDLNIILEAENFGFFAEAKIPRGVIVDDGTSDN